MVTPGAVTTTLTKISSKRMPERTGSRSNARSLPPPDGASRTLQGIGVSPGIVVGRVLVRKRPSWRAGRTQLPADQVERAGKARVDGLPVRLVLRGVAPEREDVLVGVYLDVDLASSTRTCIGHLWPRLVDGGWLMSQDGHLRLVLDVFKDPELWTSELGEEVPHPVGFGTEKLIRLQK